MATGSGASHPDGQFGEDEVGAVLRQHRQRAGRQAVLQCAAMRRAWSIASAQVRVDDAAAADRLAQEDAAGQCHFVAVDMVQDWRNSNHGGLAWATAAATDGDHCPGQPGLGAFSRAPCRSARRKAVDVEDAVAHGRRRPDLEPGSRWWG